MRHAYHIVVAFWIQRGRVRHWTFHHPSLRLVLGADKILNLPKPWISLVIRDIRALDMHIRFGRDMAGHEFMLPIPVEDGRQSSIEGRESP
jgi:hypothetical protein